MRMECMKCSKKIKNVGDAFCVKCDKNYKLNDNGNVEKLKTHKYQLTIEFESEKAVRKWRDDMTQFENGLGYFVEVVGMPDSINNTFVYGTGKIKLKKVGSK